MSTLITLITNGKKARKETLEGREYIVVPVVMIKEGVWSGNEGPAMYPGVVLANSVPHWDRKPITAYHPQLNGEYVLASEPALEGKRTIGFLANTSYATEDLASEGWVDVERAKEVEPWIVTKLEAGETVEVSTGMLGATQDKEGVWKGKKYVKVVNAIVPDHLAVLPTGTGACDIQGGCGMLRNEKFIVNCGCKEKDMDKAAKVTAIINAKKGYNEEQRAGLMTLPDDGVDLILKGVTAPPVPTPAPTPIVNQTPAPQNLTFDQIIALAPAETQEFIRAGVEAGKQKKATLIANIKASPNNRFTEEWLATQPMSLLEGMASLIPAPQTNTVLTNSVPSIPVLVNQGGGQGTPPPLLDAPSIFNVAK